MTPSHPDLRSVAQIGPQAAEDPVLVLCGWGGVVGGHPLSQDVRPDAWSAPWLAEQHHEWAEGRRYFGLDLLTRCRTAIEPITNT